MEDTPLGDHLTIGQLVDALRARFTSIMNKPAETSLHQALVYEQGIYEVLIRARSLVNSFHITLRTPPEVLGTISSYLTEKDLFSASQVCQYWRSVLISYPYLWTRISCHHGPRTIVSLGRCGSLPIQLRLEPPISNRALEDVLLHENKIISLTVHQHGNVPPLHQLLVSSGPYLERLHIYSPEHLEFGIWNRTTLEAWQYLPSLRELFVSQYSLFIPVDRLTAPNLIHLALVGTGNKQSVAAILGLLRQCPLMETLFLSHSDTLPPGAARSYSPVLLPYLRSIEVGAHEVRSGLITHLDFPKNITAGFRNMDLIDAFGDARPAVRATVQYVMGKIDISHITLAIPHNFVESVESLVRLEGSQGSLEMAVSGMVPSTLLGLFGPDGFLFSHEPRFEDVRELHIIGCYLDGDQGFHSLIAATPNVVSISLFDCGGPYMSELLAPSNPFSPPFPRLERVMVLGPEIGLEEMARRRRDLGVRLKTLFIGRAPGGFEYDRLEDYTVLEGLVDDLWVECPAQVLEWEAGNEIASIWSTVIAPEMLYSYERTSEFKTCRFNVAGKRGRVLSFRDDV